MKFNRSQFSRKNKAVSQKVQELGFSNRIEAEKSGHGETLKNVWDATK